VSIKTLETDTLTTTSDHQSPHRYFLPTKPAAAPRELQRYANKGTDNATSRRQRSIADTDVKLFPKET